MKRGPKPTLPSIKEARGTLRPHRDGLTIEMSEPSGLPQRPDWLTTAGQEVWMDDLGRVSTGKLAGERDSTMFGTYCNLQGAIIQAWRSGEVPPAAHLMEARKMAEQFGIFGAKSRLKVGVPEDGASKNPFGRNGRRT